MRLTARSSLTDVALTVGDALRRAGIRAVLTGGACAHLYSGGAYLSRDADFILGAQCSQEALDQALAAIGFSREGDRYIHATSRFFVEFPRGPLGIGEDFQIRPVWKQKRAARALVLSASDSCRDRLAAFYHWNDRQALSAAVAIAKRNRIAFARVRAWSLKEGHQAGYETFLAELRRPHSSSRRPGQSKRRLLRP